MEHRVHKVTKELSNLQKQGFLAWNKNEEYKRQKHETVEAGLRRYQDKNCPI